MRYIVTGGSGFIGSYLVKRLLADNHDVIVFDDFSRGKMENLSGVEENVTIKRADILDFESLTNSISDVDGIFHQAALTSVPESFSNPEKYHNVNVIGTKNILENSILILNTLNLKMRIVKFKKIKKCICGS